MQRLTLILSDLYLPEEATGGALPHALDLPALDALLRFAESRRVSDWRRWLALDLGLADAALQTFAQTAARAVPGFTGAHPWLATPVRLEARLDHVRLVDRGLLRLGAGEAAAWCAEFGRVFGPQYSLHAAGEGGLILGGVARSSATSIDPARLLDSDIGASLPAGSAGGELRRLVAEIEMWLHGSGLNAARRTPVSALWLWGGGEQPGDAPAAGPLRAHAYPSLRFLGSDLFLAGLARLCADATGSPTVLVPAPSRLQDLYGDAPRAIVELTPLSGPESPSLHSLEANWFAPMRAALADGSLQVCDILANDRRFEIRARSGWKIWKPRRSWLEQLGRR